jgi:hypothetical protein
MMVGPYPSGSQRRVVLVLDAVSCSNNSKYFFKISRTRPESSPLLIYNVALRMHTPVPAEMLSITAHS